MFSGIIQGIGKVVNVKSNDTFIQTNVDLSDSMIGTSICCNGVCLTATSIERIDNNQFVFCVNIGEETKKRSTFALQDLSQIINIEKSLKVGDEISGHFVYGHVDCTSAISNIQKLESSWNLEIKINDNMKKFVVEKGSISINGISLTIAKTTLDNFSISIIPHTYDNTNLKTAKVNDLVNIEFDALSRYVLNDV